MNNKDNQPELRFENFKDSWQQKLLSDSVERFSQKFDPQKNTQHFKCIELEHLSQKTGQVIGFVDSSTQSSIKTLFKKDMVLYGKLRPYLKKFWKADFDGVCSSEIWVFLSKEMTNSFLYYFIQTARFDRIANVSSGSKMPRADWSYMSNIPFYLPTSASEQNKIADFLAAVDSKIKHLTQRKQLLEKYKIGVMQKLFSQKFRFKDEYGNSYPDWEKKRVSDVFSEIKSKVQDYSDPIENYSITAGLGFISQEKKFGKDISGEQSGKYIVLEPLDFSYNKGNSKTFTYGCVYINNKKRRIAVPHVFISFKTTSLIKTVPMFYQHLFENHYLDRHLRKLISSSARMDGLLNVSKKEFFKIALPVPPFAEQQKIADFLTIIDKQIDTAEKKLVQAQEWKKGLLQKMFV